MQTLMLNERIPSLSKLRPALVKAEEALSKLPDSTPFAQFAYKYVCPTLLLKAMTGLGMYFMKSWGRSLQYKLACKEKEGL